jgi:hypothetical protein
MKMLLNLYFWISVESVNIEFNFPIKYYNIIVLRTVFDILGQKISFHWLSDDIASHKHIFEKFYILFTSDIARERLLWRMY